MLRLVRKLRPALIVCVGLILSSMLLLLFSFPALERFRADAVEAMTGETPQAKIDAFVRSVAKGDEKATLSLWELPTWNLANGRSAELQTRRVYFARKMIAQGIQPDASILDIEWWATCCEPRVIKDSRGAGGARASVQLLDREGAPVVYVFDVFTREQPYWGAALGYPARQWVVRDVYPFGQEPLYWRLMYESSIRRLD